MCTTKGEYPWMKGEKRMNKATKQNTEWEPWDKVAIFSTCLQSDLIKEALEEAILGG